MPRKGQYKRTNDDKNTMVGSSIATTPPKQRLNTDKREMDMSNPNRKGGGNTPLKVATCGGEPEAIHYDDIPESTGTKYSTPADFQTVIKNNEQQEDIPPWTSVSGYSLEDKGVATNKDNINYAKETGLTQGFHKQPDTTVHAMEDNTNIRRGHMQVVTNDGYKIVGAANSQIDKPFSPTSTTIYGGTLPKGKSSSSVS